MTHRLVGGKSLVTGEDTPHAPRAFADPRAFLTAYARSLRSRRLIETVGTGGDVAYILGL